MAARNRRNRSVHRIGSHPSSVLSVTGFAVVDDAIVIRAGTEVIRGGQPMEQGSGAGSDSRD